MFTKLFLKKFRIFNNTNIDIGEVLTAISGQNATGKSTILGLIGNSCELKKKEGQTLTKKQFRTDFSEIFQGSEKNDNSGPIGSIFYQDKDRETEIELRITWQKTSKNEPRFRILPKYQSFENNFKKSEAKLKIPSIYLGLSRLYPIGELDLKDIKKSNFNLALSEEDKSWLYKNYKHILSLNEDISTISSYQIINKKSAGINTEKYDYLTNSAGQDNLMQILLNLRSFVNLKKEFEAENKKWNGAIFTIDEIDATLHPAAQIRLIKLLYETCKENKIQCIFTTHSLNILQELTRLQKHKDGIIINYFSTANYVLENKTNPSYIYIENDMLVTTSFENTPTKLNVYSEDDEARYIINKLLKDYLYYLNIVKINLGGDSLVTLLKNDPNTFKNILFILDGDKNKHMYKDICQNYCNIIFLPGESPEKLIYDYLINLSPDHKFLQENHQKGISLRYFKENGPNSSKYNNIKEERDKYKKWFNDNIKIIDSNVIEYWIEDNIDTYNKFIKEFIYNYNILASRTNLEKIKIKESECI